MDTETIPKLTAVGEMSQKITEAHVEFMEFLLSGKISARDNVSGIVRTLETRAQDFLEQEAEAGKQAAQDLLEKIRLFSSSVVEVMDMKTRGSSDEELLSAEEKTVRPTFDAIMALLAKQNENYKAELTVIRNDVKESQSQGQLIIIGIAAFAMLTGIFLSILSERKISRPILHLAQVADDISRGDVSKPVIKESKDEIGELAEAFERMRVSLKVMMEDEG
jgi:nitrogen fixation/metabolism regulation signal transduction histidine kinase